MVLTIIRSSPEESSYIPLSTFQSETPKSFTIPVLHHRQPGNKVRVSSDQAALIPIFGLAENSSTDRLEEITTEAVDLWVTNEKLVFYNTTLSVGAEIPYLSLSLHAVQQAGNETGVYMQISLTPDISNLSNPDEHDDDQLVELTLIPKAEPASATAADSVATSQADVAIAIFKALSTCTSLHSAASNNDDDDDYDEDEDGIVFEGDNGDELRLQGFPTSAKDGWITADTVDQFRFDDSVESVPPTHLGPGAGSIRPRDGSEVEERSADANTSDIAGVVETKWRRTDL